MTHAEIAEYIRAHPQDVIDDLAVRFGMKPHKIIKICRAFGISRKRGPRGPTGPRGPKHPKRDAQIVAYAKAHPKSSYDTIGEKFNLSNACVSSICINAGYHRGKGGMHKRWTEDAPDTKLLLQLADQHLTLEQIGDHFGLTKERIRQLLERFGRVTTKPPHITINGLAHLLKASRHCIKPLVRDDDWIIRGNSRIKPTAIPRIISEFRESRRIPCKQCGKIFVTDGYSVTCSDQCHEKRRLTAHKRPYTLHNPKQRFRCAWIRDLYQLNLPESQTATEWITIAQAIHQTGLAQPDIRYITNKGLIRSQPHPTRTWRYTQKPITLIAKTDIHTAAELYRRHNGN